MASATKTIIAFDLYGTLLSTESISQELATHFEEQKAQSIAALWRRYQLEYTWRMNSMSLYKPFNEITLHSLQHALAESSETLSLPAIDSLMSAYDSLSTFPDVEPALKALAEEPSIVAYVFSNGTDSMVSSSVTKSPSLAPYANIFKELITVEDVGAYKPHPRVYEHLVKKAGKGTSKAELETIWLVSGNPFDIVGAKAVGLNAVWVDRAGGHHGNGGWNDRLGELASGGPTVIVKGLDDAVKAIKKLTEDRRMNGEESKTDNSSGAGLNHEAAAMGPG